MIFTDKRLTAVILAAGSGSRMNMNITKQKIKLQGESVLRRTVRAFEYSDAVTSIVVVTRADEVDFVKKEVLNFKKIKSVVVGGENRFDSARIGFYEAEPHSDFIAIHDGARCFVTNDMINAVFADAKKYGAATASSKVFDTVKIADEQGFINSTVNRDVIRLVQTPQIFKTELYKSALDNPNVNLNTITDDNMLLEAIGVKVFCTDTGVGNIKITTKNDLNYANYLLNGEKNNV